MGVVRRLGHWLGLGLALLLLAPLPALVLASVVDRGPAGEARPTVFPLALTVLDPFVRGCVQNSLVAAVVVTGGSLVLGVAIGRVVAGRRFWGRGPLAVLVMAPRVVPPLFVALGVRSLLGSPIESGGPGIGAGWLGWIWAELAGGVAVVASATAGAVARTEPGWADAARLVGASRLRIWRQLIWPVVRSDVARAAAAVFAWTLVEPGAPLVLGLRRTLAFQLIEAALGPDPLPRAAVLATAAVGLAAIGRGLLRWWGGTGDGLLPETPATRAEDAGWGQTSAMVLLLGAATALAWWPTGLLIVSGLAAGPPGSAGGAPSVSAWVGRLGGEVSRSWLANSLALGAAVVAVDLIVARSLAASGRRGIARRLASWPEAVPPLVLGVGALALPWLLRLAASGFGTGGGGGPVVRGLESLADGLDPDRTPGLLLVLAVSAVRLPLLARSERSARGRSRDVRIEAAVTLGASPRAARRAASPGWLGLPSGPLLLTFALAATDLAPALVLASTLDVRPVTPSILILADEPGDAHSRAAALAGLVVMVNAIALALAARGRNLPLERWFRGLA